MSGGDGDDLLDARPSQSIVRILGDAGDDTTTARPPQFMAATAKT